MRNRLLACAGFLCLLFLFAPSQVEAQVENVYPHVDCIVVDNFVHKTTALYGYENRNNFSIFIPVGLFNSFDPNPQNRGQPSGYLPGRHDEVFAVTFDQSTEPVRWFIGSHNIFVSSTDSTIPRCTTSTRRNRNDFDADGRADFVLWRPDSGTWLVTNVVDDSIRSKSFGSTGDIPALGDYDGDRRIDFAYWRPSTGEWNVMNSADGSALTRQWGAATDIPVPGDYDGDRKTDFAVWRPGEGVWYILNSSFYVAGQSTPASPFPQATVKQWGANADRPVPGDYDGDGRTDLAVFRPSEGNWYILNSSTNTITTRGWGTGTDKLVPADYDGDGKTDIAVWRPSEGNWYVINSSNNSITVRAWGASTDVPVPADYDGDGKADLAVFHPAEGKAYIVRSSDNTVKVSAVGDGDPVP